jgi:hypothetical protein
MKFLFPELGAVDPKLPRDERLKQLAGIITNEKNGRLSRTLVNRLWKKFLGRALVEPVDEMDQTPWDADLLDWLAVDLAQTNKWDVKKTMARILTSRAYQMPVVPVAEGANEQFVFRGPVVKRMTAEEFVDALSSVTGVWPAKAAFDPAGASTKLPHKKARWIWSTAGAAKSAPPGTVYFRKEIPLEDVTSGEVIITCDNRFVMYVNGVRVASGEEWSKPVAVELKGHLVNHAVNVIAVEAENTTNSPSPAGLFISGKITHRKLSAGAPPVDLGTDKSWVWSDKAAAGWQTRGFAAASGWKGAVELGNETIGPWKLNEKLAEGVQLASGPEVRSALCTADPLTTSLGRSNREQVLTDRASVATTLQALEMSNGSTLAEMLKKSAGKLAGDKSVDSTQLVERVFVRALGRRPTAGEMATASEMIGQPVKAEGVEDLLWVVAMLPEFQLIR